MSLLGPDDFELDGKKRKKKLAKDLSPAHQKMIEKWLDDLDNPKLFERLADLVGPDEARRRIAQRRLRRKKPAHEDLLEE
ncbi:MAG: hypothetical protein ACW99U_19155 [Candidatus Thorarchaeota archaeon]